MLHLFIGTLVTPPEIKKLLKNKKWVKEMLITYNLSWNFWNLRVKITLYSMYDVFKTLAQNTTGGYLCFVSIIFLNGRKT